MIDPCSIDSVSADNVKGFENVVDSHGKEQYLRMETHTEKIVSSISFNLVVCFGRWSARYV